MNNPYERQWKKVMIELLNTVCPFEMWFYRHRMDMRLTKWTDGMWRCLYGDWSIDSEREWWKRHGRPQPRFQRHRP